VKDMQQKYPSFQKICNYFKERLAMDNNESEPNMLELAAKDMFVKECQNDDSISCNQSEY